MRNDIIVSLKNIAAEYDGERVIDHLNLDIRNEEFITFLGPSGCGKTTTLRIIGGFVDPVEGDVFFDGKRINGLPPYRRHVNTVFQRYALFPHLNVFENVAFGLRLKKMPSEQIQKKVRAMLELVNLAGYENRNINQLPTGSTTPRWGSRADSSNGWPSPEPLLMSRRYYCWTSR